MADLPGRPRPHPRLETGNRTLDRAHRRRHQYSRAHRRRRKGARDTGRGKLAYQGSQIRSQGRIAATAADWSGSHSFLPLKVACEHPCDIHMPSHWMAKMDAFMADDVRELRPRTADTEKITVNLGYVDLGHVDLMVQEGFYSNRTDFIRAAIRNQLERHADVVRQSTARKRLDLGLRNYTREDLEAAQRAGEMLQINVLGLATIAQDVTPELARATIASVSVLGALHATPAVEAALADRGGATDSEKNQGTCKNPPHSCRPTGRGPCAPATHASGR